MVCGQETRNKGETWMRLLKYNLLAVAVLLFFAANASAYTITMTTTYDGSIVGQSDSITVKVWLDTNGESNIKTMEVGVKFDVGTLSYERSLSTTGGAPSFPGFPNYILYGSAPNGAGTLVTYMEPRVQVPNGFTWDPAILIVPGQVNIGWLEVGSNGTSATATNALLATLVFHVIPDAVSSDVALTLSDGGTLFNLGGGVGIINDQVILGPGIHVPEPGVLAVSFAALVTLGGLRRYKRRNR
jgi:hypothetical protein